MPAPHASPDAAAHAPRPPGRLRRRTSRTLQTAAPSAVTLNDRMCKKAGHSCRLRMAQHSFANQGSSLRLQLLGSWRSPWEVAAEQRREGARASERRHECPICFAIQVV